MVASAFSWLAGLPRSADGSSISSDIPGNWPIRADTAHGLACPTTRVGWWKPGCELNAEVCVGLGSKLRSDQDRSSL
jgi:hypothetical protein